ncbi:MAG: right-handed parallel beta-helix repeat-containing protein [Chloroflexota bacterium]
MGSTRLQVLRRAGAWRSPVKWLLVLALVVTPTFVVGVAPVFAQASRTWVSGVGDDANPCSRTAPCKTFAGAISKTATGGEISVLDPGGFGAVTITKSITIDGGTGAGWGSIVAAGSNGIIVNATAGTETVILRHLSINGFGDGTSPGLNGIRIIAAKQVIVDEVEAFGFKSAGNGYGLIDTRQVNGVNLVISNSSFNNNSVAGIGIVSADTSNTKRINASIDTVEVAGNGSGISIAFGAGVTIRNSIIGQNTLAGGFGLIVQSNNTDVTVVDSAIVGNQTGLSLQTGSPTVRLNNVTISGNTANGVAISSGQVFTAQNNRVTGNAGNNTLGGSAIPAQ